VEALPRDLRATAPGACDGEFVRAVSLVELSPDGDQIARLRNYFYTPEVIAELCGELDLPCRTNGTFRARGDSRASPRTPTTSLPC
jgi:hypothetical protein